MEVWIDVSEQKVVKILEILKKMRYEDIPVQSIKARHRSKELEVLPQGRLLNQYR